MNKKLKRVHVITKTICHCFLGLLEYVGVPFLLAYLTTFLSPISEDNQIWKWIERVVFCFTIYEVILVGIRKMIIDTRKDALLALKTAYERSGLYCECGNEAIRTELTGQVTRVLDTGVLNQIDIIDSYNNLLQYIENKNSDQIKYKIIKIQHSIETDGLLWNYTLFFRLFKR